MKLGPISARRVARWLVARRYLLLVAGAIAAIACLQPAGELQFDRSVENMFADDDPVLPAFARLKRVFRAGDVVLAAYDDPQLMTPAGMDRVARVAGDMQKVPGVEAVSGLHGLGGRLGPLSDDLQKLLVGFTHSADGQTAALICFLRPDADAGPTLAAMRGVIELEGGVLAGETVMINDGFRYLEEDGRRLGWISTVLLAATIIYCFRSIRWVIVPIAVVQLSLLATRATLALSGYRLSMVSSMLTSIVTVVAVAAVMRVIIGFRDGRAEGRSPRAALVAALYVLIVPTSWSCVTDALGFGSLLVAEVGPVRDFGLMTALGCLWALAALVLLVPGLALIGGVDTDPRRVWGENVLDVWLSRMVNVASNWPRTVSLLCIAATAFLAAGAARLDVETDFTKNFRAASPIARSYDFVETQLGGAGMWDVLVPAPRTLDDAYLARLRRLARRLRTEAGVELEATRGLTGVLAISDVLDTLPLRGFTRFKLAALHRLTPQLYRSLYAEDPDEPGRFYCRIMLRARERESAEAKRELIATVERIAAQEFPAERAPHGGGPEVTGYYVLLTKMIDSVLRDQWFTFGVSAASIAIVLVIAFRSLGFAIAAMVPNLLPVFAVLGLLGWSGLKMNMGAAMIAAVSLGLSVNSSIHYIAIFNHARRRGKTLADALDEAQQSIGRASVFATLALVIGFSALCLSEFIPTVYFGALVALALFGGLLGNLVILPLLLAWIDRKPKPQGDGSRFRNGVSQ